MPHPNPEKANYAARGQTIELHWQNGVLIPDRQPTGIEAHIQRKTAERVFLDLLDRVMAEGQYVSHKPNGNYAPRIFSQRPDRERFTKADFQRAMHALFAAREIRVGSIKTEQRKTVECLVREVAPSHL